MKWRQAPWLVCTPSVQEPEQQGHPRELDAEHAPQLKRSQTLPWQQAAQYHLLCEHLAFVKPLYVGLWECRSTTEIEILWPMILF